MPESTDMSKLIPPGVLREKEPSSPASIESERRKRHVRPVWIVLILLLPCLALTFLFGPAGYFAVSCLRDRLIEVAKLLLTPRRWRAGRLSGRCGGAHCRQHILHLREYAIGNTCCSCDADRRRNRGTGALTRARRRSIRRGARASP